MKSREQDKRECLKAGAWIMGIMMFIILSQIVRYFEAGNATRGWIGIGAEALLFIIGSIIICSMPKPQPQKETLR